MRAVVEVLAKALVDSPGGIRVTETQHEQVTLIELYVPQRDMAKVLGRMGRTAAALRTPRGHRRRARRKTGDARDTRSAMRFRTAEIRLQMQSEI